MVSVREILRTTREERQISLEQVQGELGIPLHYLEAMEGRTSKLIADEFYLVPFLRRYGDFLELDGASLVARFLAESARNEAGQSRSPMSDKPTRRWIWLAGLALVALVGILALWVVSNGATEDPGVGVGAGTRPADPVVTHPVDRSVAVSRP